MGRERKRKLQSSRISALELHYTTEPLLHCNIAIMSYFSMESSHRPAVGKAVY
jgi:hypothetical protein